MRMCIQMEHTSRNIDIGPLHNHCVPCQSRLFCDQKLRVQQDQTWLGIWNILVKSTEKAKPREFRCKEKYKLWKETLYNLWFVLECFPSALLSFLSHFPYPYSAMTWYIRMNYQGNSAIVVQLSVTSTNMFGTKGILHGNIGVFRFTIQTG